MTPLFKTPNTLCHINVSLVQIVYIHVPMWTSSGLFTEHPLNNPDHDQKNSGPVDHYPAQPSLHLPILFTPFHAVTLTSRNSEGIGGRGDACGGGCCLAPEPAEAWGMGTVRGKVRPGHCACWSDAAHMPLTVFLALLSKAKICSAVMVAWLPNPWGASRSDTVIYSVLGRTLTGKTEEINPWFSKNSQSNWWCEICGHLETLYNRATTHG